MLVLDMRPEALNLGPRLVTVTEGAVEGHLLGTLGSSRRRSQIAVMEHDSRRWCSSELEWQLVFKCSITRRVVR